MPICFNKAPIISNYLRVCFYKFGRSIFYPYFGSRKDGVVGEKRCFLPNIVVDVTVFSYLCIGKVEKDCTEMPLLGGKNGILPPSNYREISNVLCAHGAKVLQPHT